TTSVLLPLCPSLPAPPRDLHSFPTRRSSDLIAPSTYGVIPGNDSTFQDLCDHAGAENLAWTLGHLHGHEAPPNEQMLTWPIDRVDRKSTRLNSSHLVISYAVFCLKKKKQVPSSVLFARQTSAQTLVLSGAIEPPMKRSSLFVVFPLADLALVAHL